MKIKLKKLNEHGDFIIVDDELNVGDCVTLNYYTGAESATVVEIDYKGKWIKVQMDLKGDIRTFYLTTIKDYTLFTDTGSSLFNKYGVYLSLKVRKNYFDY